ncbi:MAG TPA: hypothetical protein PLA90_11370 [Candidatus Sumerlaeota bacterium]|nr:hypothetical protein [Candidatus Sumerlaeota bacterium]
MRSWSIVTPFYCWGFLLAGVDKLDGKRLCAGLLYALGGVQSLEFGNPVMGLHCGLERVFFVGDVLQGFDLVETEARETLLLSGLNVLKRVLAREFAQCLNVGLHGHVRKRLVSRIENGWVLFGEHGRNLANGVTKQVQTRNDFAPSGY